MKKEKVVMKELTSHFIKTFTVLIILLLTFQIPVALKGSPHNGQDFSISVRNFTQTSDRTFEFDLYLLDTDPSQPFELASVQCGISVNPAIYAGGTFSASLVSGTSGLNPSQFPASVAFTTGTAANIIKLSAISPPGSGSGTILSTVSPGTRVVRIKLTSTLPFPSNSQANLAFCSSSALGPSYASRVAIYQSGINTQISVTPGSNATILENPLLNPSFPVAFPVIGGGNCCESSAGLPVGLAGSQLGITYKLFRNDIQTGPAIIGTGAAINFPGNQIAGTYTVTGTNANGTSTMLNSVMVIMNPPPVLATQQNLTNIAISNGQSLCYEALITINVAGGGTTFTVASGGTTHLVAGEKISLFPGTTVQSGGTFHAYIATDCIYCSSPKNSLVANDSAQTGSNFLSTSNNDNNKLFHLYPNPTSGKITVELLNPVNDHNFILEIFGMDGRVISTKELPTQTIHNFDLGGFPSGLYLIRLISGEEGQTGRIIKR
jgi:hypothetical protein